MLEWYVFNMIHKGGFVNIWPDFMYRGSSACTNSTSTIFQKDPYFFGLHENISLVRWNIELFVQHEFPSVLKFALQEFPSVPLLSHVHNLHCTYRVTQRKLYFLKLLWQIEICKLDLIWWLFWNAEIMNFWHTNQFLFRAHSVPSIGPDVRNTLHTLFWP